jgi:hypothetical protein
LREKIGKRKFKRLGLAIQEYKEEMRKARDQKRELKKKVKNSEVLKKVMSKFFEDEAEVGSDHEENDDIVKVIDVFSEFQREKWIKIYFENRETLRMKEKKAWIRTWRVSLTMMKKKTGKITWDSGNSFWTNWRTKKKD